MILVFGILSVQNIGVTVDDGRKVIAKVSVEALKRVA